MKNKTQSLETQLIKAAEVAGLRVSFSDDSIRLHDSFTGWTVSFGETGATAAKIDRNTGTFGQSKFLTMNEALELLAITLK